MFDKAKSSWGLAVVVVLSLIYFILCRFMTLDTAENDAVGNNAWENEIIASNFVRNMEINLDFRYEALAGMSENVFQTGSGNNGIRFELVQAGLTGIGGVVYPVGENGAFDAIMLNSLPIKGIWHHLQVKIINNKMGVYLDGALVDERQVNSSDIAINDIAVGTGFSRERNFSGDVKNFSFITYKNSRVMNILPFLILLLLDLWLMYKIFGKQKIEQKFGGVILALASLGMMYRGTRMYIMSSDQWACYAILLGVYLLGFWIWRGLKLYDYAVATGLISVFILLKCFLLKVSFAGCLTDFVTGLFCFIAFRLILSKISGRKMVIIPASIAGGLVLGFITMAVFYARRMNNDSMLFGEEVQSIMQTNPQEAWEFIQTMFSAGQIAAGILLLFVYVGWLYFILERPLVAVVFNRKYMLGFGVAVILCMAGNYFLGVAQSLAAPILSVMQNYADSMEQMKYYQGLRGHSSGLTATKEDHGETYVLVIGESANKRHMSSYGYFRETTPWLDKLRSDDNAVFMENAYANYVHTVPALLNALTSANQYNQKVNFAATSIIEVARAAGFRTYWFSNQNRYGLVDNPLTIIADEADEVYWTPTSNRGPDGELLKLLDDKLHDLNPETNNLIIVHLIGSHEAYLKRLPVGYNTIWRENGMEYFGDIAKDDEYMKENVDTYDATIKYTDENLEKIYALISAKVEDLSAFVYVSDHGQDVFGRKNHNASIFDFEMARIPMVTLVSDKWKNRYKGKFEEMRLHRDSPYTTDCLYDYLLGISGIKTGEYEADKDLTETGYGLTWENAMMLWTDKNLQLQFYAKTEAHKLAEDPLYIKRKNISFLNEKSNKYLAVHCDSVGAACEAMEEGFCGVEVNITPTEGKIMMGHAPELVMNMTLEEWLQEVPQDKIEQLWLDVKFASPDLLGHTLEEMERLDKVYHLKERSLVETSVIDEQVKLFSDAGWEVSYYFLPTRNSVSDEIVCPEVLFRAVENKTGRDYMYESPRDAEEQKKIKLYASAVANVIERERVKNISFWSECYEFINTDVLPFLTGNIGFATFSIPGFPAVSDGEFINKFETYQYKRIIDDERMKRILISPETIFRISL